MMQRDLLRDLPDVSALIGQRLMEILGPGADGEIEFIFENGTALTFDAPDGDRRLCGIETQDER